MKYKIKKTGLLALLVLFFFDVYSQADTTNSVMESSVVVENGAEKTDTKETSRLRQNTSGINSSPNTLTWKLSTKANKNDSISAATIVVGSEEIANMKLLIPEIPTLLDYLNDSIINTLQDSINILQDSIGALRSAMTDIQTKVTRGECGYTQSWVRIMLVIFAMMVFGLIVYVFVFLRNEMDDKLTKFGQRIDRRKEAIAKLYETIDKLSNNTHNRDMNSVEKKVLGLEKKNDELLNKVTILEEMFREKNASYGLEPVVSTIQQSSSRHSDSQKLLYADSIIDKVLIRVREQENDDAIFVLKLKDNYRASITLYEQAYNRILANASFLDGCEKQIIGKNSIEIVREGEAEMGSNGKWKVVTPLKVEMR